MGKMKTLLKNLIVCNGSPSSPPQPATPQSSQSTGQSTSLSTRPVASDDDEEYKSVYLMLVSETIQLDLAMIDPNGNCALRLIPEMKMKFPIYLNTVAFCGYAARDSKIYFIGGGLYPDGQFMARPKSRSDKVYAYDLNSKVWDEPSACLKRARAYPQVIIIGNRIYVCGGDVSTFTQDDWMEFYDENDKTWNSLPTPVPKLLLENTRSMSCTGVYERGKKIFFFVAMIGVFSLNYDDMVTWDFECEELHGCPTFEFCKVVIERDILFCASRMNIYGYDLCNKFNLVFKHNLGNTSICYNCLEQLNLFRVGKDTLLLVSWDEPCQISKADKGILCFRYQIKYSTKYRCGFRLKQVVSQRFASNHFLGLDHVLGPSYYTSSAQVING